MITDLDDNGKIYDVYYDKQDIFIKNLIVEKGPVISSIDVYSDYGYYSGGIYEHKWGIFKGTHTVIIVGYDDEQSCWIIKESLGQDWGEPNPYDPNNQRGWSRIKYGEVDINHRILSVGIVSDIDSGIPVSIHTSKNQYLPLEEILFNGNTGEPGSDYIWNWDFDDGSTSEEQNPVHKYVTLGYKKVVLTVYDNEDNQGSASKTLLVDTAPNKPSLTGPSSGRVREEYTFSATSTDNDGDDIYYRFSWDDGASSDWFGPHSSGDPVDATHEWVSQKSYSVKVKCKDVYGVESPWSNPVIIDISRVKINSFNVFTNQLFEKISSFDLLRIFINLLFN
jgi:hypothetical protein